MKIILGFIYNGNTYLVVDDKTKIFLGRYVNGEFVSIPDLEKASLKNIIKLLLVKNFSKKSLAAQNVMIINTKKYSLKGGLPNAIILELKGEMRDNFIKNCSKLSKVKTKSSKSNKSLIVLFIIALIVMLVVGLVMFLPNIDFGENSSGNNLLEKYTYVRDENLTGFYNMKYEEVNITSRESDNLFEDYYVSFENKYNNYLFSTHYDITYSQNSYSGDVELDITYYNDSYDSLSLYDLNKYNQQYNISIEDSFKRNNINNSVDLVYGIILNSQKEVTNKSSEQEMIDNLVFEIFRPLVIPYDNDSQINEFIFFKGDKYGYAHITDSSVFIVLRNGKNEYHINYNYSVLETQITKEDVVNIVSTLKFNQ